MLDVDTLLKSIRYRELPTRRSADRPGYFGSYLVYR